MSGEGKFCLSCDRELLRREFARKGRLERRDLVLKTTRDGFTVGPMHQGYIQCEIVREEEKAFEKFMGLLIRRRAATVEKMTIQP